MEEPAGFRVFVERRSRQLLRFGWLLTNDWAAAEDLVQSALVVSWQHWADITPVDPARFRYVQRVMTTTYLRWRRRHWTGEVPTAMLPQDHSSPDRVDEAVLRQALLSALQGLSPRQRAVVVLRYFADVSEADTAAMLGCSVGAVKSHTSRALGRLRAVPGLAELSSGGVTG